MTMDGGRTAFAGHAWADAYGELSAADGERPLGADDLERLAIAAYLVGRYPESADGWARAHQAFLGRGEVERAARAAFWLALGLLFQGEAARAGGWLTRAGRVLDEDGRECAERGLLLVPVALRSLAAGDSEAAYATFTRAGEIGARFADPEVVTLGRLGQGQSLIRSGKIVDGVTLLDEAMVAVEAREVSPIAVGIIYCAVIETCQEIFDVRRAHEWTTALSDWCEAQPDLVPYRGQCLVRRAEIMQLHGEWPDAMEEAERACEWLTGPPAQPAAGAAFYQCGEIRRVRGELAEAEQAYGEASKLGRSPQPGLAQLRLAQGRLGDALAAIRRLADEARERRARSRILPVYVEIMLAAGEVDAARCAADELAGIAGELGAPLPHAVADAARGAVLLAAGEADAALDPLRRACAAWRDLDAPYEVARARVLIGLACREHDDDTASMELDAARWAFDRIGAVPDRNRVDDLMGGRPPHGAHGLTPRELEVLRGVAGGGTNRAIAAELFISERTVERHVSNIFTKLHVSSRAAATAYAYEHRLV